ncbi:dUTP diphosphatase [Candidatus Woesearchaeota archaeon]|nr:dUTP diphosphatase [Candidatus Woesearchaeota archaeon]
MKVLIQRVDKTVELPKYQHEHDAAIDLRSAEDKILQPMERAVIKTGIAIAIPLHHVGLIWDRSGLAAKHGLHCLAGVVDPTYRGEIGVVLVNLGKESFTIEKNMRIAQMLIQPVANHFALGEVESLDATERNEQGFGSSGYH